MNYSIIIGTLLIIVILYYIIKWSFSTGTLTSTMIAKKPITISSNKIETKSNFTYSIWFYIDDWNYKFGNK